MKNNRNHLQRYKENVFLFSMFGYEEEEYSHFSLYQFEYRRTVKILTSICNNTVVKRDSVLYFLNIFIGFGTAWRLTENKLHQYLKETLILSSKNSKKKSFFN